METQENHISPNHERLINIASWAGLLAKIAIWMGLIGAALSLFSNITNLSRSFSVADSFLGPNPFSFFGVDLYIWISITYGFAYGILKSFVNYLVLKGVELGLTMIVETDVNYRMVKTEEENDGK